MAYFADQPRVVRRPAANDDHLGEALHVLVAHRQLVEHQPAVGIEPTTEGLPHRLRLLVDLLEHEVVVAGLLRGRGVPVDVELLARRPASPSMSVTRTPSRRSSTNWSWSSAPRGPGVCDERGHVAGEEVLAVAEADDQRQVAAGADDEIRLIAMGDDEDEGAFEVWRTRCAPRQRGRRRSALRSGARQLRCRSRSSATWSRCSSPSRSSVKFSIVPLCTTATAPVQSTCGCALRSFGAPWVAQRVCPIPRVPCSVPASAWSASASSAGWPACRPAGRR